MHAAEAHLKCPEVFGPVQSLVPLRVSRQATAGRTDRKGCSIFASFIRLLSERLAESNLGDDLEIRAKMVTYEVLVPCPFGK